MPALFFVAMAYHHMDRPLRVAVAGASGIGRHHANWHARVGSQVVAILGSSPQRCSQTTRRLRELFGFEGRSYTTLSELLERECPDIVDVCTPNELHFDCVAASLDAGCHVLCEKPLVWNADLEASALIAQAQELIGRARQAGRHLSLCTQYACALGHYRRLRPQWEPAESRIYAAELETLARGRLRDAEAVWVDMGSHPLSLILAAFPGARIESDSLRVGFSGREARAVFAITDGDSRCACDVVVRDRDGGVPLRRFGFDGLQVDVLGRPGEDGVYRSVLRRDGQEDEGQDYMHLLIQQYTEVVRGTASALLVPADIALRNLELQLQVREAV